MTEFNASVNSQPHFERESTRWRLPLFSGLLGVIVGRMVIERGAMQSINWAGPVGAGLLWVGLALFILGSLMYLGGKSGRFILRQSILNSVAWRGDEQVLDVGCGQGLLLVDAARRSPSGRVVGVDLSPQGAANLNGSAPAMETARIAGVSDRVELKNVNGTGRDLPAADASIDVIVSGSAVHTLVDSSDREHLIREMARVLKPGGQLALGDTLYTQDYEQVLRSLGWEQTQLSSIGFVFVPKATVLRATKP
jgi:arsenite methyltransferase